MVFLGDIRSGSEIVNEIATGEYQYILGCLSDCKFTKLFELSDAVADLTTTAAAALSSGPEGFTKSLLSALGVGGFTASVINWGKAASRSFLRTSRLIYRANLWLRLLILYFTTKRYLHMKYLFLALLLALSVFNVADARLYTEEEAVAEMNAYWAEKRRNPENLSAEEWQKRDIEAVQKDSRENKNYYNGSGSYVSDRDVYIDGKLYHCVQYQFNTQCHID